MALVKKKFTVLQFLLMLFLFALTLTMIVPILNIFAKSLSSPKESVAMSGLAILPKDIDFINYRIVFSHPILMPALWNSIVIGWVTISNPSSRDPSCLQ